MDNVGIMEGNIKKRKFKLGTTSFIVPDHIIPNVERLGPFFDEIELLVFESRPEAVIPSKEDVKRLLALSREHSLTYNIHLPTDIDLTSPDPEKRQRARDMIIKVMERFEALCPTTHTLHLPMPQNAVKGSNPSELRKQWLPDTYSGVDSLVEALGDPGAVSIETLNYPFEVVEPVINEFDLKVTIDAGHQIKYGHTLLQTMARHAPRTPLIHLHGVDVSIEPPKDHTALDLLPEKFLNQVFQLLNSYTGVVSLEVFNLENLNRSLAILDKRFYPVPAPIKIID